MKTLTASWDRIVLMNYTVPSEQVSPLLLPGLELDETKPGEAGISLVGFDLNRPRLFGIIPGPSVAEVNLRVYVKDKQGRKGVQFISEVAPSRRIAWGARAFGEPFSYLFTQHVYWVDSETHTTERSDEFYSGYPIDLTFGASYLTNYRLPTDPEYYWCGRKVAFTRRGAYEVEWSDGAWMVSVNPMKARFPSKESLIKRFGPLAGFMFPVSCMVVRGCPVTVRRS